MTTITLDDELINQVIAKSHYKNAEEAVIKILSDYLQQTNESDITEQPSKWALLVQEIENTPALQLNGYAEQMQKDMQEVRENFIFLSDETR